MSCRLCLKIIKSMILLTSYDVMKIKIKDCLNIDVNDVTELPKKICSECHEKIEDFYAFRQISCRSDRILRNALKSNTLHIFFDSEKDVRYYENESLKSENQESDLEIEELHDVGNESLVPTHLNNDDEGSEENAIVIEDTSDLDFILSDYEEACEIEKIIVKHEKDDESDSRFECTQNEIENDKDSQDCQSDDALKINFICKYCKNEFNSNKQFLSHQRLCFGSSRNGYKCYVCQKSYNLKEDLLEHTKIHLTYKLEYDLRNKNISENQLDKDSMKVKCTLCTKIMLKRSLKQHLIKHTDRFKCPKCPARSSSRANLWVHIKSSHTKIRDFSCMLCGKQFAHAALLKVHMKSHSDVRLYKCQLCNYAGRTSSALRSHNKSHQTERPHLCDMCAKMYRTISELRLHKRRTHFGERKNKCHLCGQAYFQKYKLDVHMRSHTGDKPYTCKMCNKSYRRSDSLGEHMKKHKNLVHKCDKCSKVFLSKRSIKRHTC